ncbi:MAG: inositol monophosphatase family protein [Pseudomonadota bacterium]|nr:inositol monophosphatase family protein [Pseudomonadota bacterium]
MNDLAGLAALATRAARAAGELLKARPERPDLGVVKKGAVDLVTEVDLASERVIRALLTREAPGIAFQGEEGGGATTGTRWAVDPIDGTTNFVHGYPFYCVSIALIEGAVPVVGVIYDPVRDRLHAGWQGGGATVNGAPLRVSSVSTLDAALSVTGFPYDRRQNAPRYLALVQRALEQTQGVRRSGSAAMDLTTIATGYADLFWEHQLKPWDTSAGVVLVREAGGVVTRLDGSPWDPDAADLLATNGFVHEAAVGMVAPPMR